MLVCRPGLLHNGPMTASRGRVVAGRYQILELIGSGGMGSVYLAEQLGVGKRVAIKFLAARYISDEAVAQRFMREGRVGVEVTHPGAAQLLDMGRDEDELYLVFEYVGGENLTERIEREGPMPFEDAKEIVLRVAEVLAFAHDHGIVHRDVKPDNIRVLKDLSGTHVKVLDFGIAKWVKQDPNLTAEGSMAGTPRYMAPEQIRGEPVDGRSDLYSLGLILFELLTGKPAFAAKNVPQLLLQQLQNPVPSLAELNPSLQYPQLDALIQKACAKNPQARFRHLAEFITALKTVRLDKSSKLVPASGLPHQEVTSGANPAFTRTLATMYPDGPQPKVAHQKRTAVWFALGIMGAACVISSGLLATWFWVRSNVNNEAIANPLASADCPALKMYNAELRALSVDELEARVARSRLVPPSAAGQQLKTLRASQQQFAVEQRDCLYRTSLIAMVAGEETTLKSSPELWGQQFSSDALELQILELPTTRNLSLAQRKQALQQIDSQLVSVLSKENPQDADHWRRMYRGIFLLCEVTDDALATLDAERPRTCPSLSQ